MALIRKNRTFRLALGSVAVGILVSRAEIRRPTG